MSAASENRHNTDFRDGFSVIQMGIVLFLSFSTTLLAGENRVNEATPELSRQIDALIKIAWQREQVRPAPQATDSEFIRRVSLDLTGKIPPVSDVRQFLADNSTDKRKRYIDRLLSSPGFVVHFTTLWRNILIPEANANLLGRQQIPEFESWLRAQLRQNVAYDEMVRQIINAPFNTTTDTGTSDSGFAAGLSPRAFYLSKQLKPENLAASTSRAFLGVRIECAQCHDHPFDSWKQEQFWKFAAFYANIDQGQQNNPPGTAILREVTGKPQIKIPDTNRLVDATFLNGSQPDWAQPQISPRRELSEWITSLQNPYFARATANRVWSLFFGRGLVDPVDDFSTANPASHPELLDLLAGSFQKQGYDLKYLIRAITNSQTYQRSSRQTDPSQNRAEWYGKMATRGLSAEQIFASLVQATGFFQQTTDTIPLLATPGANTPQSEIYDLFQSDAENQLDPQATILQALAMMNGAFITNATSLEQSDVFTAIVEFPEQTDEQRIEAFYLSTLSRIPTSREVSRLKTYLASTNSEEEKTEAYANLFWALLNSSEFLLNH